MYIVHTVKVDRLHFNISYEYHCMSVLTSAVKSEYLFLVFRNVMIL